MSSCNKGPAGDWYKDAKNIDGLLLDIFGVLYDSGDAGDEVIPGSIEAINKLSAAGIPVRLCSNTSTKSKEDLAAQLERLGFSINHQHLFTPIPAVKQLLKDRNLRPYLVVHSDVVSEFSDIDQRDPNCVVIGDAGNAFSYQNVNKAFQVLIGSSKPCLITLGAGKYYKETDGMKLDCGTYAKALEAVMIGDDIVSDVGGAKACGLRGVQVRTGKYRDSDEPHPEVKPDGYVDNLLQAVELFLKYKS